MAAGEKVIPEITVGNQTYKLMDETAREHLVEVKSTTPTSEDNRLWIKEMSAAEEEANTYEVPTIDEFNDLKSAINTLDGVELLQFSGKGYSINTSGTTADITNPSYSAGSPIRYAVADCSVGDKFIINGTGATYALLWAFINGSGDVLSKSDANAVGTNLVVIAPTNAAKIIVNTVDDGVCYKGNILFTGGTIENLTANNSLIVWESGNIDIAGNKLTSAKNFRTIHAIGGENIEKVSCASGYVMAVARYNKSGVFVDRTSFNVTNYVINNDRDYEYKFVIGKSDASVFDIENIKSVFSVTYIYKDLLNLFRQPTLASNSNLNDIKTPGTYFIASGALSGLQNAPDNVAALLIVFCFAGNNTSVQQVWINYLKTPYTVYRRAYDYSASKWGNWIRTTTDVNSLTYAGIPVYVQGNIGLDGNDVASITQVRTDFKLLSTKIKSVYVNDGYYFAVATYNKTSGTATRSSFNQREFTSVNNPNIEYRFTIRRSDDGEISVEEAANNFNVVTITSDNYLQIGNMLLSYPAIIPGKQAYENDYSNYGYCAWPFGTSIYDEDEGTVCVAYTSKHHHEDENSGAYVMKRLDLSTNTWSDPITIAGNVSGKSMHGDVLAILDNGDYIAIYSDQMYSGKMYMAISSDHGDTWATSPVMSNGSQVEGEALCYFFKTSTGRYLTYFLANGTTPSVLYTDDLETWTKVSIGLNSNTAYEGSFVQLQNGTICLLVRNGTGQGKVPTYMYKSQDDGETWTELGEIPYFDATSAPITLWRDDSDNRIHMFFASKYLRNSKVQYYTMSVTDDELINMKMPEPKIAWTVKVTATGDSGYSTVTRVGNDRIFIFFYAPVQSLNNLKQSRIWYSEGRIRGKKDADIAMI